MFEIFTQQEIEQLNRLKEQVILTPSDYFFKSCKNITEFTDVGTSMLLLQWQYLSSGLTLVIETFRAISKSVYSLLIFDFLEAKNQVGIVVKSALAAIAKLTLNLVLLFLQTTRLLTLLVATFFPQVVLLTVAVAAIGFTPLLFTLLGIGGVGAGLCVAGTCLGLLVCLLDKPKASKEIEKLDNIIHDLDDLNYSFKSISQEKAQIVQEIDRLSESLALTRQLAVTNNRYKLFSIDVESSLEDKRESYERRELSQQLNELINTYPEYIPARVKEPGYVRWIHHETAEHHARVVNIAQQYFNQVNNLLGQCSYSLALSLPVIP